MKGIILSGGSGTRLRPLTRVTSKQLLPIYNKPMIYYPLEKLINAGIKDILIIVAPDHCGDYMKLLGSGKEFGVKFTYEIQDKPEGLAQAFIIGEDFIDNDDVTMILGDNVFEDEISNAITNFKNGGLIFAKKVNDPHRYGVVAFDQDMKVTKIEEKPKEWISDYAIPGIYIFDKNCVEAAKSAKPSERGEIEITEIHNWYLERGQLQTKILEGAWFDAGTFESYVETSHFVLELAKNGRELGVKDPRDRK